MGSLEKTDSDEDRVNGHLGGRGWLARPRRTEILTIINLSKFARETRSLRNMCTCYAGELRGFCRTKRISRFPDGPCTGLSSLPTTSNPTSVAA